MRDNNEIRPKDASFKRISFGRRVEMNFWKNCSLIAFGIILANIVCKDAISFGSIFSYVGLVFVIWVLNAVLRPFLVLFTLPFIVLTFGAGMVFINALVIWIASFLIPFVKFESYWYALIASLFIEIISWIVAMFEREKVQRRKKDKDVIDL